MRGKRKAKRKKSASQTDLVLGGGLSAVVGHLGGPSEDALETFVHQQPILLLLVLARVVQHGICTETEQLVDFLRLQLLESVVALGLIFRPLAYGTGISKPNALRSRVSNIPSTTVERPSFLLAVSNICFS